MPRVKLGKSPAQLAEEARERHEGKVIDVIRVQMAIRDVSRRELAEMTSVDYQKIGKILRGDMSIDLWTMKLIADALKFSPEQRAAVVGGKLNLEKEVLNNA